VTSDITLQTHSLKKVFDDKVAVQDLSITVKRGEVFGFLGPNGAGKTTSVKMLLGLVHPTSGEGELLGAKLGDYRARSKVGFLPEHFRFHDWLNADEFLQLHADLYRLPTDSAKKKINELLDLVALTPHRQKKLRQYSKGMLQRVGLAQALLNDPELVILDEPTSGLDPVGRRLVRDIIRDLRGRGTSVFLNSHLLSEVEITCDRVAFVKNGVVVREEELHKLTSGEISLEIKAKGLSDVLIKEIRGMNEIGNVRVDGDHLSLTVKREEMLPQINRLLVERGVEVFAFRPQKISLEDLFFEIVGTDGGL
jgi:ABC-2 type transport system ATP-binding protein